MSSAARDHIKKLKKINAFQRLKFYVEFLALSFEILYMHLPTKNHKLTTYNLQPTTYNPQPTTYNPQPITYNP